MLNIFQLKNNHLLHINEKHKIHSLNEIIWIDIIESNNNYEQNYIYNILEKNKIKIFKLKNIKKNKRFFKENNELHIQSYFFSKNNTQQNKINNSTVYFIIHNNCLHTIRKEESSTFYTYQKSINNQLIINENAYEILLNLFEIKLNELTDQTEYIYESLEKLNLITISKQQINKYHSILSDLSILEDIEWKIRINLLDTERTINFLLQKAELSSTQKKYTKQILQKNIKLLLKHNKYTSQKINLLTQTIIGFISIQQNRIIKIFSIIFLPPTLIASSYGMNFEFMPELHWPFGYPSAIIIMILTGLLPYIYFKHKNWL